VYLPDVPRPEYQALLAALEEEFTYTFGGCTTVRGLEGNYLSRLGLRMRDRINLVYTDTPFAFEENFDLVSRYADELREAAFEALDEEASWSLCSRYTTRSELISERSPFTALSQGAHRSARLLGEAERVAARALRGTAPSAPAPRGSPRPLRFRAARGPGKRTFPP
jgi:hypothetical protein